MPSVCLLVGLSIGWHKCCSGIKKITAVTEYPFCDHKSLHNMLLGQNLFFQHIKALALKGGKQNGREEKSKISFFQQQQQKLHILK